MKKAIGILLLVASAMSAVAADQKTATPDRPNDMPGLPAGAVAKTDGTWSYTDKAGKKWIFSKTPFGYSRMPAAAASGAVLPAGVPKGALLNADGTYSYTDPQGKKWTYVTTAFGASRTPASQPVAADQNAAKTTAAPEPEIRAIDKGNTVRFEKKGLMGASVWEKKKSDLTDDEKRIYEAQKSAPQK